MYYYKHHIGDYRRDTSHLSLLEHGIYRQLLDLYYITEKPLDANALRLINARTNEEKEATKLILKEFFVLEGNVYIHKRCEDEIVQYHEKSGKASASAKARWNKNKDLQNANALRTVCESDANHKPLTINHKPKYIPPIPEELLSEWMQIRGKKKPVTERVFNALVREAKKIGWTPEQAIVKCCERNWIGFEASWVSKEEKQNTNETHPALRNWI